MARYAAIICLIGLVAGCGGDDKQAIGATGDKAKESCKRELKNLTGLERVRLVKVEDTEVDGGEAAVTAVIERQGQRLKQFYRLKQEDGDWKLSGAS